MLPKLTVISPPMAGPSAEAACSVARQIQPASTAIASAPATKIHAGDEPKRYFRSGATGTITSGHVTVNQVPDSFDASLTGLVITESMIT